MGLSETVMRQVVLMKELNNSTWDADEMGHVYECDSVVISFHGTPLGLQIEFHLFALGTWQSPEIATRPTALHCFAVKPLLLNYDPQYRLQELQLTACPSPSLRNPGDLPRPHLTNNQRWICRRRLIACCGFLGFSYSSLR